MRQTMRLYLCRNGSTEIQKKIEKNAKRLGAKNTGRETSVYPENLPKREVRTNPKENTDSRQRHQYITSSFGEFKCLLFVHCVHLSIC